MQFKTSKGILNIPGEWEGVVCFEKQVDGATWIDDILNDKGSGDKPKIGCYYYNNTAAKNLPGREKDPFYRALVKNTNGTEAGLRPFALDQNTLYVNKGNMLAYIHKSSGLSQVKVESSNKSTKATNADHAAEADYATQALLAGSALKMVVNSGTEESPNYTDIGLGNANMPVYFSNGIPVACDYRVVTRIDTTKVGLLEIADGKGSSSSNWFWEWPRTLPTFQAGTNAGYYYAFNNNGSSSKRKIRMNAIYVELGKFIVATAEIKLDSDVIVDDLVLCWPAKDHIDDVLSCDCSPISMQVSPLLNNYQDESSILCAHVAGSSDKNCYVIADTNGTFGGCYITVFAVKN